MKHNGCGAAVWVIDALIDRGPFRFTIPRELVGEDTLLIPTVHSSRSTARRADEVEAVAAAIRADDGDAIAVAPTSRPTTRSMPLRAPRWMGTARCRYG